MIGPNFDRYFIRIKLIKLSHLLTSSKFDISAQWLTLRREKKDPVTIEKEQIIAMSRRARYVWENPAHFPSALNHLGEAGTSETTQDHKFSKLEGFVEIISTMGLSIILVTWIFIFNWAFEVSSDLVREALEGNGRRHIRKLSLLLEEVDKLSLVMLVSGLLVRGIRKDERQQSSRKCLKR